MKCKIIFSLALLFFSLFSFSQRVKRKGVEPIDISKNKNRPITTPVFVISQFVGKWQEVYRTSANNQPVDFKDTIFLDISPSGKVSTEQGMAVKMTGEASIDEPGNILLVASDVYTVLSVEAEKIILQDDNKTIHAIEKKEIFWHDTLGKLANNVAVFKDPVAPAFASLKGTWKVYRRQSKPGSLQDSVKLIQSFSIKDSVNEQSANGEISFYISTKTEVLPCNIQFTNAGFVITADKNTWNFNLYKADGKELVFGDADVLLYFAKPL